MRFEGFKKKIDAAARALVIAASVAGPTPAKTEQEPIPQTIDVGRNRVKKTLDGLKAETSEKVDAPFMDGPETKKENDNLEH